MKVSNVQVLPSIGSCTSVQLIGICEALLFSEPG